MNPPDGFSLSKCIRSGERGGVYVAEEEATGRRFILKTYRGYGAHASARAEYERFRKLAGPGLLPAVDLDTDVPEPYVALAAFQGETLAYRARRAPTVDAWLHLASQLAACLRHLHAKHWIHRGLCPEDVWVGFETQEVGLLCLELAVELGSGGSREGEGDFLYMAPEQFGRMGRGVDFRSDLYSLGATLYHLLTGRPPFSVNDPLEAIHAHMAQRPPSPCELRPDTPAPLARLLLKLLAKEPDDRYQTANALHQDLLECQRLWVTHASIPDDFELGLSDAASRPLFSKRLYGRDSEIRALGEGLDRVRAGGSELWLIRGAPGSGKSVLIQELHARSLQSGWLAQGKFDLYRRDHAYSGWAAALEALAQQILVRGEAEIEAWRQRVLDSLGANASVLVEWIPDWGFILGELPRALRLEPRETQVRLARTTMRLLRALGSPDEPLILFLDDLQWADSGSRFLLREVAREPGPGGLLLVGTYRDGEVDAQHPLTPLLEELPGAELPVHTLDIGPLTRDATLQMLADALAKSREEVQDLAQVVLTKTENNPFLIQQFVDHMRSLGHIGFAASGGWHWDLEAITSAEISDDAVELIAARIEQLEPYAREVLVFASFIGDEFDAEMLGVLANRDLAAVEFALCALSESGLVVPCRAGFRFVHDRIREAAQSLRSQEERTRLHHDTAVLLLERTDPRQLAASATEIVEHFNRAIPLVSAEKASKVVQLNTWAAQRALEAGAPGTARVYADTAHELAKRPDVELDPGLELELDLIRAQTLILAGAYEEADEILGRWAERELDPIDIARAAALRVDLYIFMARESGSHMRERAEEAMEIGTAALRKLRAPYPSDPGQLRTLLQVLRAHWKLRRVTADTFLRESRATDARQQAIVRMEVALSPIYTTRRYRGLYANAYHLRRFWDGYAGDFLPGALASIAIAVLLGFGWREHAERYGRICLELLERGYSAARGAGSAIAAHYLIFAWNRHYSEVAKDVEALTYATLEEGDLIMGSAGAVIVGILRLQAGEPLEDTVRAFRAAEEFSLRAHDVGFGRAFREGAEILECLQNPLSLDPDAPPYTVSGRPMAEAVRGLYWLILQDYRRAFDAFEHGLQGFGYPDSLPFHRALTCALLIGTPDCPDERYCKKLFKCEHAELRRRVRFAARNFLHQRLLIDAERARLAGRSRAALGSALESAKLAREAGYPLDAALALERVAQLLCDSNRRLEGSETLDQARSIYERWGALAKVAQIDERHGGMHVRARKAVPV